MEISLSTGALVAVIIGIVLLIIIIVVIVLVCSGACRNTNRRDEDPTAKRQREAVKKVIVSSSPRKLQRSIAALSENRKEKKKNQLLLKKKNDGETIDFNLQDVIDDVLTNNSNNNKKKNFGGGDNINKNSLITDLQEQDGVRGKKYLSSTLEEEEEGEAQKQERQRRTKQFQENEQHRHLVGIFDKNYINNLSGTPLPISVALYLFQYATTTIHDSLKKDFIQQHQQHQQQKNKNKQSAAAATPSFSFRVLPDDFLFQYDLKKKMHIEWKRKLSKAAKTDPNQSEADVPVIVTVPTEEEEEETEKDQKEQQENKKSSSSSSCFELPSILSSSSSKKSDQKQQKQRKQPPIEYFADAASKFLSHQEYWQTLRNCAAAVTDVKNSDPNLVSWSILNLRKIHLATEKLIEPSSIEIFDENYNRNDNNQQQQQNESETENENENEDDENIINVDKPQTKIPRHSVVAKNEAAVKVVSTYNDLVHIMMEPEVRRRLTICSRAGLINRLLKSTCGIIYDLRVVFYRPSGTSTTTNSRRHRNRNQRNQNALKSNKVVILATKSEVAVDDIKSSENQQEQEKQQEDLLLDDEFEEDDNEVIFSDESLFYFHEVMLEIIFAIRRKLKLAKNLENKNNNNLIQKNYSSSTFPVPGETDIERKRRIQQILSPSKSVIFSNSSSDYGNINDNNNGALLTSSESDLLNDNDNTNNNGKKDENETANKNKFDFPEGFENWTAGQVEKYYFDQDYKNDQILDEHVREFDRCLQSFWRAAETHFSRINNNNNNINNDNDFLTPFSSSKKSSSSSSISRMKKPRLCPPSLIYSLGELLQQLCLLTFPKENENGEEEGTSFQYYSPFSRRRGNTYSYNNSSSNIYSATRGRSISPMRKNLSSSSSSSTTVPKNMNKKNLMKQKEAITTKLLSLPPDVYSLIQWLLAPNPQSRPDITIVNKQLIDLRTNYGLTTNEFDNFVTRMVRVDFRKKVVGENDNDEQEEENEEDFVFVSDHSPPRPIVIESSPPPLPRSSSSIYTPKENNNYYLG